MKQLPGRIILLFLLCLSLPRSYAQLRYLEPDTFGRLPEIYGPVRIDAERLVLAAICKTEFVENKAIFGYLFCILDNQGTIKRTRVFTELPGKPPAIHIKQIAAAGNCIVLAGRATDYIDSDRFVAILDTDLNVLGWGPGALHAPVQSVLPLSGNRFIVAGIGKGGVMLQDTYHIVISDSSNGSFDRISYGSPDWPEDQELVDMAATADGNRMFFLHRDNGGNADLRLACADSSGHVVWQQTYGTENSRALMLRPFAGGYLLVIKKDVRYRDGLLIHTDEKGGILASTSFGGMLYRSRDDIRTPAQEADFSKRKGKETALRISDVSVLPDGDVLLLASVSYFIHEPGNDFARQLTSLALLRFNSGLQLKTVYRYPAEGDFIPGKLLPVSGSTYLISALHYGRSGGGCVQPVDIVTMQGWEPYTLHTLPY